MKRVRIHFCPNVNFVKFIYPEQATKFCEISTLLLTGTTQDKSIFRDATILTFGSLPCQFQNH